jgi:molecular chaperone DnaK
MADLKEALKGDDPDTIKAKTDVLAQASMKIGEAMYKAQAGAAGGATPGGEPGGGSGAKKDDVVDAEYTEVDDDKKKSA